MANTDLSIEDEIAQHELRRAQAGNPAIGDSVMYCRQDNISSVEEYPARITAMYEDLSADLSVTYINGPINVPHVRFDPSGVPSSWHPRGA